MLGQKPLIVSGDSAGTIRVWDLETGKQIVKPLKGHEHPIQSLAVGMLGQKPVIILAGSWDDTIRVWDFERRRSKAIQIGSHCN
ncbi:MAG: hypothetical protein GTN82_11305 [Candidatus Aminicenantes bacterium]|nr:hypothetical protein [Candidatus Aminicenantes bacterium]NIN18581.1 hypothetical protein [Candidatus Aminicenantes bacterium]NIQ67323.1 hypothetical protein [Candidatus Aminicenantes bacterium]NIR06004.1 hypothetical protein [Candidatus Aminicenantes bacterium]NIT23349.1 hypothetical protein [Candidatus Aminicenantes bacterium]